jgi:hypothetical protein
MEDIKYTLGIDAIKWLEVRSICTVLDRAGSGGLAGHDGYGFLRRIEEGVEAVNGELAISF